MLPVGSGAGDDAASPGVSAAAVAVSVLPPEGSAVGSPEQAVRTSAGSAAAARTSRARVITSLKRTQQMLPQSDCNAPLHARQVEQRPQLLAGQFSGGPDREPTEPDGTDAGARQPIHRMAHGIHHAPDDAVAALVEGDRQQ